MTPLLAVFLVLVVSASSYAAGRLHGQLSYRVGYRFGYRQGYFDGDRGAWHRRRYESNSALAAVLSGEASATPEPESGARGTTYRGGTFVPATVTTHNVRLTRDTRTTHDTRTARAGVMAERTAAVGTVPPPAKVVGPATRKTANAVVAGRGETGKPTNAAMVPGRALAWKPATRPGAAATVPPAGAAAVPTVSAPPAPPDITAVPPAPQGTPLRMPRAAAPTPEPGTGEDGPDSGTPAD